MPAIIRNKVFVSYSHKDKKLFEEFKTMLAPAIRDGAVDVWDDTRIVPGAKWKDEILKALGSAKVAVLLVSQYFLASDFIARHELPPLLKAAQDQGVTVFWICLSSCLYEQTEIATYQAAHDVSKPLDRLDKPHRQAILSEVCAKLVHVAQPSPAVSSQVTIISGPARARIFVSYRHVDPDKQIAEEVFAALKEKHEVFIDRNLRVGTDWAKRIEDELRLADFLIVFLSAQSVESQMVEAEISTAYRLVQETGRPNILPVRMAYTEPFRYPLSAYLDRFHWASWSSPADTAGLIRELLEVLGGGELVSDLGQTPSSDSGGERPQFTPPSPSAQPTIVETPDGPIETDSPFYLARKSDAVALAAIAKEGVTITIKGPEQIGKSSLLLRIRNAAIKAGKRVVFLDFQLFDRTALKDTDLFFRQFCAYLTDELGMEDHVAEHWNNPLGNLQRCTRYMSHILKQLDSSLVLAMDEVEHIFDAEFHSDFFGMLRSWHNSRRPNSEWKRLDLALVTSSEPYKFINATQSPFNVGEVIQLDDFTDEQVATLNRLHHSPLQSNEQGRLMQLLRGHPYLIRRALYLIASQQFSVVDLIAQAATDDGPFGDHLRYHLLQLHKRNDLIPSMRQIIDYKTCADDQVLRRLHGAGLVRREGKSVLPRCQLYAEYFRERLHG